MTTEVYFLNDVGPTFRIGYGFNFISLRSSRFDLFIAYLHNGFIVCYYIRIVSLIGRSRNPVVNVIVKYLLLNVLLYTNKTSFEIYTATTQMNVLTPSFMASLNPFQIIYNVRLYRHILNDGRIDCLVNFLGYIVQF